MKPASAILSLLLLTGMIFSSGSSCQSQTKVPELELVASTPGDPAITFILGLPALSRAHFIRWQLMINDEQHSFTLTVLYGESKPNTNGFIKEQRQTYTGAYTTAKNNGTNNDIYILKSKTFNADLHLAKITADLYHILNADHSFISGNGSWSYALNKKGSTKTRVTSFASLPATDTASRKVFDGRTLCQDFASNYALHVSHECIKMKWRLILHFDPLTHRPTTYHMSRILHEAKDTTGTWTIIKGTPDNPNAIIYQLNPDIPEKRLSFLMADDNILLFLRREGDLFVGNADFSYVLNRIRN